MAAATFPGPERLWLDDRDPAPPGGPSPSDAAGGRGSPRVRRDDDPRLRRSDPSGWHDSMPFLFLGAACLALAVLFRVSDPAPGNRLPLWLLLIVVGGVALAGGLVGALMKNEERPEPAPRRARSGTAGAFEARRRSAPERPLDLFAAAPRAEASHAAPSAAPSDASPWEPGGSVFDSDFLGARRPARASPATPPRAPPAAPRLLPTPAASQAGVAPSPALFPRETEDVMRSLEELTHYLQTPRPVHRSEPVPEPVPPPAEQICAGCEAGMAREDAAGSCRSCGLALCSPCWETSEKVANPGLCPTCALLDEPFERTRPAGTARLLDGLK